MRNFFVCLIAAAFAIAIGDHVYHVTYWQAAGSKITIAWELPAESAPATHYKWQDWSPTRKVVLSKGTTQQTQVEVIVASGHNVFSVAACNDQGCTEQTYSTDSSRASVDGQAKGWWIFGVLGKPGPIGT